MAADNKTLGNFNLDGIPPAPRGVPQIEVTFSLDVSGLLSVSAKDRGTGKEQKITITASSSLSKEEIEKMQKDAEMHAEEDKKIREMVDTKNEADSLINSTEKSLKDYGDKLSSDEKSKVESALSKLKEEKDKNNIDDLKKALEDAKQASYIIGQKMYESQQDSQPQPDVHNTSNSGSSDGVDYEVKDA